MSETAERQADRRGVRRGDPSDALLTYRYLRFGILGAVILLALSILYEWLDTGPSCLQGSVSAYYYTPARSIFVGTLMAVGLCLIVIRGRTLAEDMLLNLAGMLAPVVALVPTSGQGSCATIRQSPEPTVVKDGEKQLAEWVVANVENNITALFITGAMALIGLVVYFLLRRRTGDTPTTADTSVRVAASLAVTTAVVGAGALGFFLSDAFERHAHYVAAITMFAFFGVVVLLSDRAKPPSPYKRWYRGIWILMLLGVLVVVPDYRHKVFVLEALEIFLFACFWVIQSRERWFEEDPARAVAAA